MSLSVIIPMYRAESTIGAALDSVALQGIDALEVICINDFSPDASEAAAHRWCAEHPEWATRIQVLSTPSNGGPALARNLGLSHATGKWVAFLDGDDAWLPGKLKLQLELAAAHPEVVLWCGRTREWHGERELVGSCPSDLGDWTKTSERPEDAVVDESGAFAKADTSSLTHRHTDGQSPVHCPPSTVPFSLTDFLVNNPVATSTVLVKRAAIEDAGGFDEAFCGPEDYDLWMRVVAVGKGMRIDQELSLYRVVDGSLSLDDEHFLPQIIAVLRKAYGAGGVLAGQAACGKALAYQHLCAAWSSGRRGAMPRAWRLWLMSIKYWRRSFSPEFDIPLARTKLAWFLTKATIIPGTGGGQGGRPSCPENRGDRRRETIDHRL